MALAHRGIAMSKHTPGPWVVTPHPDQNVDVFAVGEVTDEAFQYGLSHTICYQNAEANARLIAAAPELLEALTRLEAELVEDKYGEGYEPLQGENMALARSAIAKATGEA
jgi:hypothetical protein